MGRVAIVTGGNRGIGFAVAQELAARGCSVWIAARDPESGSEAAARLTDLGYDATALVLDVTDEGSIANAAARIMNEVGRLDILVNNAGQALDGDALPSAIGMACVRATFEINLFGVIAVTQAFLPFLRKSAGGRIVMVSSDIGSHGRRTDPSFAYYALNPLAYSASKAALNAATISFAKELIGTEIKVNAANPSFTSTALNGFTGVLTVEQGAAPIVALAMLADDGPTGVFWGPDGPEPW